MTSKKRKMVQDAIACDTNRLFGDLPTAIKYLVEMREEHKDKPDFHLEEHWPGYEEMELRFVYLRPETVHEAIERRVREHKLKKASADLARARVQEQQVEEARTSPERILWLENRKKAALMRMEMGQAAVIPAYLT